jgi:hypothetical protein
MDIFPKLNYKSAENKFIFIIRWGNPQEKATHHCGI